MSCVRNRNFRKGFLESAYFLLRSLCCKRNDSLEAEDSADEVLSSWTPDFFELRKCKGIR